MIAGSILAVSGTGYSAKAIPSPSASRSEEGSAMTTVTQGTSNRQRQPARCPKAEERSKDLTGTELATQKQGV
jgi:hypothetical protein